MAKLIVITAVAVAMIWVVVSFMGSATSTVKKHKAQVERALNY